MPGGRPTSERTNKFFYNMKKWFKGGTDRHFGEIALDCAALGREVEPFCIATINESCDGCAFYHTEPAYDIDGKELR